VAKQLLLGLWDTAHATPIPASPISHFPSVVFDIVDASAAISRKSAVDAVPKGGVSRGDESSQPAGVHAQPAGKSSPHFSWRRTLRFFARGLLLGCGFLLLEQTDQIFLCGPSHQIELDKFHRALVGTAPAVAVILKEQSHDQPGANCSLRRPANRLRQCPRLRTSSGLSGLRTLTFALSSIARCP